MRHPSLARVVGAVLLLSVALTARPAFAQFDLAGNWARRSGEDARALGAEGAHIGDYTGIPLNEAGRVRAETWDSSVWSERERQAEPHSSQTEELEIPLETVDYLAQFAGEERTVWIDGRPQPPEWAEHTWQGFSTGKWNGNVLTVTTTHMKTGSLNRNGTPSSSKAVMTEHFIRHGDQLTVVQIVNDPAYLEEPFIRTLDFVRNPNPPGAANHQVLEIIDEITTWPKGYVPSYALGSKHADWAESVGLPFEASRGGKETLYPEYVPIVEKMVHEYQTAKAVAAAKAAATPARPK